MAGLVLLSGCDLSVSSVDVPASQRAACRALVTSLPKHLGGLDRRDVSHPAYAAAWGDPAVVLRCGVPRTPRGYTPTSTCQVIDGVDWFTPGDQIGDPNTTAVVTTLGRVPAVELRVPPEQRLNQGVLADASAALRGHTTVRSRCP